jgi:hypothetical protein
MEPSQVVDCSVAYQEVGSLSAVGTPFIDFHSSGTSSDYDTRWNATGGNATAGSGTLTFYGAQLTINAPLSAGSITASNGVYSFKNGTNGGGVGSWSNGWLAGFVTSKHRTDHLLQPRHRR